MKDEIWMKISLRLFTSLFERLHNFYLQERFYNWMHDFFHHRSYAKQFTNSFFHHKYFILSNTNFPRKNPQNVENIFLLMRCDVIF